MVLVGSIIGPSYQSQSQCIWESSYVLFFIVNSEANYAMYSSMDVHPKLLSSYPLPFKFCATQETYISHGTCWFYVDVFQKWQWMPHVKYFNHLQKDDYGVIHLIDFL